MEDALTCPSSLRFRDVQVRFGRRTALDGLDLEIAPGETVALVGPNGAGKTTAIRAACGLVTPSRGAVEVDGVVQPDPAPASIGYCPQANVFYEDLTVLENLDFVASLFGVPASGRAGRIHGLAAGVGLGDRSDTRARHLSGGMQRRLTLALACVHDPSLLIIEEPEAGLDPHSRIAVRRFLARMQGKRTLVFSSHHLEEVASLADRVALLDHGRLLACGTPAEMARFAAPADAEGPLRRGRLEDAFLALTGEAP